MKITVLGAEEYALKLSRLGSASEGIAKKAVYQAADVVADAVKANLQAMPVVDNNYNIMAYAQHKKARMSEAQRDGLVESFGISRMQNDGGYINVKLGFDGYNSIRTQKYPQGQPNVLIARIYENGGSTAEKQPFIKPALNKTRKAAQQKMADVIDEEMSKLMR